MMNDLIRRADAVALASGGCHPANLAEEIAKLPSAQSDVPDTNVGDTISRQAAIDAVSKGCQELRGVFGRCEENLLDLPSAQRWIPCSERLPDEEGRYLVTVLLYFDEYPYVSVSSFAHDLESVDKYGFEGRKRAGWYSYDDEYGYLERDGVVAWMPLPEPYREDGEQCAVN